MSSQIYGSVNDDDFIEIFNGEELQESSGVNVSMTDISVGDPLTPGSLSQRLTRVFRKSNFIIPIIKEGTSSLGENFLISDLPWTLDYDTKLLAALFKARSELDIVHFDPTPFPIYEMRSLQTTTYD